ncbi:MAG: hypothetical protein ACYS9X_06105 [Planctomycetota bacterium]|jgi:hypothetical protein
MKKAAIVLIGVGSFSLLVALRKLITPVIQAGPYAPPGLAIGLSFLCLTAGLVICLVRYAMRSGDGGSELFLIPSVISLTASVSAVLSPDLSLFVTWYPEGIGILFLLFYAIVPTGSGGQPTSGSTAQSDTRPAGDP